MDEQCANVPTNRLTELLGSFLAAGRSGSHAVAKFANAARFVASIADSRLTGLAIDDARSLLVIAEMLPQRVERLHERRHVLFRR